MTVVAVTGAAGAVGQRVLELLANRPDVARIVALDRRPIPSPTSVAGAVEQVPGELASVDLKAAFDGVDVVVHLAWEPPGPNDAVRAPAPSVEVTRRVLDAAASAGVGHVVALSSAVVYGAWPDNPVPITEAATVRPNPGFPYAAQKAEAERLIGEWREEHPGATACVLRPAVLLGDGDEPWLTRALGGGRAVRARDTTPPAQFLTPGDLASAVVLAASRRLDGAYNVAPDGWIAGEVARTLGGGTAGLAIPERLLRRAAGALWALRLSTTPPAAVAYNLHPWVVANDRLRAEGWEPTATNEEALVGGRSGSWWRELSPKRRQEVTLSVSATGLLGLVGATVAAARAVRRRRARAG